MSHSEAASSPGGKLPMHAAMDSDTIASVSSLSPLELSRLQWKPTLPNVLRGDIRLQHGDPTTAYADQTAIAERFPCTYGQRSVSFTSSKEATPPADAAAASSTSATATPASESTTGLPTHPLRVGIVLSGGPASGGHNVIVGLYDFLVERIHTESKLYGFIDGPSGLIESNYVEITRSMVDRFRNQGGFHMIGSGRTKIESPAHFRATAATCEKLALDGLVVVGGDDCLQQGTMVARFEQNPIPVEKIRQGEQLVGADGRVVLAAHDALRKPNPEATYRLRTRTAEYSASAEHRVTLRWCRNPSITVAWSAEDSVFYAIAAWYDRATLKQVTKRFPCHPTDAERLHVERRARQSINAKASVDAASSNASASCSGEANAEVDERAEVDLELLARDRAAIATGLLVVPSGGSTGALTQPTVLGLSSHELRQTAGPAVDYLLSLASDTYMQAGQLFELTAKELADRWREFQIGSKSGGALVAAQEVLLPLVADDVSPSISRPATPTTPTPVDESMHLATTRVFLPGGRTKAFDASCVAGRVAYQLHHPLVTSCGETSLHVGGSVSTALQSLDRIHAALLIQADESAGLVVAELNPRVAENTGEMSSLATKFADACLTSMRFLLTCGAETIVAFGDDARARWLSPDWAAKCSHDGDVLVTRVSEAYLHGVRRLDVTVRYPLRQTNERLVRVVFAPHPSTTRDGRWVARAIAQAHDPAGDHCNPAAIDALASAWGVSTIRDVTRDAKTATVYALQVVPVAHVFHADGSVIAATEAHQFESQRFALANGLLTHNSNTNAALIAEYFKVNHMKTRCVGAPKTIDGDLRNEFIEISFGFDTACRVFSEQVAALCADAVSARKSYHVCRLMGRTASHITLEVALQTHPNIALIGEEIQAKGQTLSDITKHIADVICTRALQGKHYGCIILPEGLVDFLPDVAALIAELNELMAASKGLGLPSNLQAHLSPSAHGLFTTLPAAISQQLLLDRDPHGNVQVSKIESERLVAGLVEGELLRRKKLGTFKGSPSFVCHFLGYEGRCGLPSNFDANYCYALGQTTGALLATGQTGMIATVQKLTTPTADWQCGGLPLTALMNLERRSGHDKAVIRKALVRLEDTPFQVFETLREGWKYQDSYRNPGAIQYSGEHADIRNMTLEMEQRKTTTTTPPTTTEDIKSKL